jgi:ABC-type sulfate/molybdate transport systems ATPase subunit
MPHCRARPATTGRTEKTYAAGKSTTMRVILGLDAADAGTALIGGRPYQAQEAQEAQERNSGR